jgi:hypothetical protein
MRTLQRKQWIGLAVAGIGIAAVVVGAQSGAKPAAERKQERTSPLGYEDTPHLPGQKWRVHDLNRPRPAKIDPGSPSTQERPGRPPSDAIVLFDGKDLSHWVEREKGQTREARWKVENGYMEITSGTGSLQTKEKFGDIQLHVEWAAPPVLDGSGQWRGNSGVLIMNRYEIQVLDSWENPTYADGQAASIYGQWPPFVNASRKPGEWQTFDIVFEAPRFEGEKLVKPAFVTVFHNGVVMHHRQEIIGRMAHRVVGTYTPHEPEEPLGLQNHDTKTRYRQIWVRRLKGYDQQ